jgi:hypothetical protein
LSLIVSDFMQIKTFYLNFPSSNSNIFKKYYLPLIICLPASLGAIFCKYLPEKNLHIDGLGLFNFYIEFVIKQSTNKFIRWLRSSKVAATILFSIFNTSILYSLLRLKSNRFWFVSPGKKESTTDENENLLEKKEKICVHSNLSCEEYLKKVK